MSKGPGIIERRIADHFALTRDRALSIDEIARCAFLLIGRKPTRAQRLSATRAAHRLVRRVREMDSKTDALRDKAHKNTQAALGLAERPANWRRRKDYEDLLERDPAWIAAHKLLQEAERIGRWHRHVPAERRGSLKSETDHWCATTVKRRLYFHPPDVPVQVWAVSVERGGVTWHEAEIVKITERNVMVRYAGETARLGRLDLWYWWAFWRGVQFVSSRTGRIANEIDALWQRRYGHAAGGVPPVMRMPIAQAMALLGLAADYTREAVIAAFRRAVKKAHPDAGGTAEMFRVLVEARDRLLAALGTSAPAPKPPSYAPKGSRIVYGRSNRSISSQRRLGVSTRRLT